MTLHIDEPGVMDLMHAVEVASVLNGARLTDAEIAERAAFALRLDDWTPADLALQLVSANAQDMSRKAMLRSALKWFLTDSAVAEIESGEITPESLGGAA